MPADDLHTRNERPTFVPADGYAALFEDAPSPTAEDLALLRPVAKVTTIRTLPTAPRTAVA
jgi:hypothetical protein